MDPSTIKALLMATAYEGAIAVLGNAPALPSGATAPVAVNADPLVKDSGMQAKGIAVYEEAKVQYAVLVQAFQDTTGIWPNPQLPAAIAPVAAAAGGKAAGTAATAAIQSLTSSPAANVAALAAQLLAAVQAAAQAPASAPAPTTGASPVPPLGSVTAGS